MLRILFIDATKIWLFGPKQKHLYDLEIVLPPVGLVSIATYLKNKFKEEVEIKVISLIVDCHEEGEFLAILQEYNPDIVGIRGLIIHKEVFHNTAKIVKQFNNKIVVVGGGPYPTSMHEAIKDENLDYIVLGEGEITFSEMVESFIRGQKPLGVKGIAFRSGQDLVINPPQPVIQNLDSLPLPDYNFVSLKKYASFLGWSHTRRRQLPVFSSRGCPYHCIYCHSIFGKTFRPRSAQNVFEEIKKANQDFSIKDFYFLDDTFNLDYQRGIDIFDSIIKSGLKINLLFVNGLRGDIVDNLFIDKMVEAGTIWVTYAIETASQRLQKYIRKNINLEKLADNIHYTCAKDIVVNCFFMIGFPTETADEALMTLEYAKQFKKVVIPYFHAVRYYPNTELYDLALKEGFDPAEIEKTYDDFFHNVMNSKTPLISREFFQDLFFKYLNEVFLSKERLQNAIRIQKRFFTDEEILGAYSQFFRRRIKDLDKEVLAIAR